MAGWKFERNGEPQSPGSFCEELARSLNGLGHALDGLHQHGTDFSEAAPFLADVVWDMAKEVEKAMDAYRGMELKPRPHLEVVRGGEER